MIFLRGVPPRIRAPYGLGHKGPYGPLAIRASAIRALMAVARRALLASAIRASAIRALMVWYGSVGRAPSYTQGICT